MRVGSAIPLFLLLALAAPPAGAAKPPPCEAGLFLVAAAESPLVPGGAAVPDQLALGADGSLALASGCPAVAAKQKGAKEGNKLSAKWTKKKGLCTGLAKTASLAARFDASCDVLTGTFKSKGVKRAFTARRRPAELKVIPPGGLPDLAAGFSGTGPANAFGVHAWGADRERRFASVVADTDALGRLDLEWDGVNASQRDAVGPVTRIGNGATLTSDVEPDAQGSVVGVEAHGSAPEVSGGIQPSTYFQLDFEVTGAPFEATLASFAVAGGSSAWFYRRTAAGAFEALRCEAPGNPSCTQTTGNVFTLDPGRYQLQGRASAGTSDLEVTFALAP